MQTHTKTTHANTYKSIQHHEFMIVTNSCLSVQLSCNSDTQPNQALSQHKSNMQFNIAHISFGFGWHSTSQQSLGSSNLEISKDGQRQVPQSGSFRARFYQFPHHDPYQLEPKPTRDLPTRNHSIQWAE